jgi:hypothetical protein
MEFYNKIYPEGSVLSPQWKEMVRNNGIPCAIRPKVWMQSSGAAALREEYPELYAYLLHREYADLVKGNDENNHEILSFVSNIQKGIRFLIVDVYRTFPDNILFTPSKGAFHEMNCLVPFNNVEGNQYIRSLRQVLVCFAYYSWKSKPDIPLPKSCTYQIGYCQSLNLIVGMLLLVFTSSDSDTFSNFNIGDPKTVYDIEESVFWMLVSIVENIMPPDVYGVDLNGAIAQQQLFWDKIVPNHGSDLGLGPFLEWMGMQSGYSSGSDTDSNASTGSSLAMISTSWFMSLFVGVLPVNTLLRIWDSLFFQGEKILFKTALVILSQHQEELIKNEDYCDAWKSLKDAPAKRFDEHRFIKSVFLSQSLRRRVSILSLYQLFNISSHDSVSEGKITRRMIAKYRQGALSPKISLDY